MSDLKYCQGPKCHTHKTKDRIKGTQGNKTYQTRRRSKFYYGNDNFCSTWCQNDWFNKYGDQAIDHFGRTTEVKHLTEENAWVKRYNYRGYEKEQYNDSNYTLNTI
jgi:hypothetical protein